MELSCNVVWKHCLGLWRRGRLVSRRMSACQLGVLSRCSSMSAYRAAMACHQGSPLSWACTPAPPWRSLCVSPQTPLCWSCKAVVSGCELFCPACSSLQPPDDSRDYFHILGCDRSFNIDIQELQNKYRNLQRFLHPDYYSQKSQHEQQISEQHSSIVNKAYNTLLSPLRRGIYLLSLHGIALTEGTEDGMDSPFLFEILEINEKLNETNSHADIEEIGLFIQDKCQLLTKQISDAFEKGDLEGAKMILARLKYYSNILDQVKKKIIP